LKHIKSTEPLTIMAGHVTNETLSLTGQRQRPFYRGSIISDVYYSLNPRKPDQTAVVVPPDRENRTSDYVTASPLRGIMKKNGILQTSVRGFFRDIISELQVQNQSLSNKYYLAEQDHISRSGMTRRQIGQISDSPSGGSTPWQRDIKATVSVHHLLHLALDAWNIFLDEGNTINNVERNGQNKVIMVTVYGRNGKEIKLFDENDGINELVRLIEGQTQKDRNLVRDTNNLMDYLMEMIFVPYIEYHAGTYKRDVNAEVNKFKLYMQTIRTLFPACKAANFRNNDHEILLALDELGINIRDISSLEDIGNKLIAGAVKCLVPSGYFGSADMAEALMRTFMDQSIINYENVRLGGLGFKLDDLMK